MYVGTASGSWKFNPFYHWIASPPFEQMLTETAESGYEGTEISYHFPTGAPSLRADLGRHGLRAAVTFHTVLLLNPALHDVEVARMLPVADRLQALGCDTLILPDEATPRRLAVADGVADDGSDLRRLGDC